MGKAELPQARLGWRLNGEWLPLDCEGPNRAAAEKTVEVLRELGRFEVVDESQVTAFVMLGEAVDADPTNAALWGQYRAAEQALRGLGVDANDDPFAKFVADLSASVRDATVEEPKDTRGRGGEGRGGARAAVDAVAAPGRGRSKRAAP